MPAFCFCFSLFTVARTSCPVAQTHIHTRTSAHISARVCMHAICTCVCVCLFVCLTKRKQLQIRRKKETWRQHRRRAMSVRKIDLCAIPKISANTYTHTRLYLHTYICMYVCITHILSACCHRSLPCPLSAWCGLRGRRVEFACVVQHNVANSDFQLYPFNIWLLTLPIPIYRTHTHTPTHIQRTTSLPSPIGICLLPSRSHGADSAARFYSAHLFNVCPTQRWHLSAACGAINFLFARRQSRR